MLIGYCGAHRTGKTTLAKKTAEYYGKMFVATEVGNFLASQNIEPISLQHTTWDFFVDIQRRTIHYLCNLAKSLKEKSSASETTDTALHNKDSVIFVDRTPLDALAYTQAFFSSKDFEYLRNNPMFHNVMEECEKEAMEGMKYFDAVFVVQPGIAVCPEHNKALPDVTYMEQLNKLIIGNAYAFLANQGNMEEDVILTPRISVIPKHILPLEDRIAYLDDIFGYEFGMEKYNNVRPDRYASGVEP